MPDPLTPTASVLTLAGGAATVPVLTLAGYSLGLRADVLLAGFAGALAAMAMLNTVRGTGDTWRELLRTSGRRVGVAITSALTAGYVTPLVGLIDKLPDALLLSAAFVIGAGAQRILAALIIRFANKAQGGEGTQ